LQFAEKKVRVDIQHPGVMDLGVQDAVKGSRRPAVVSANVEKTPETATLTDQSSISQLSTGISKAAIQGPKSFNSRSQPDKPTTTNGMKGKTTLIQELDDSSLPRRDTSGKAVPKIIPPKPKSSSSPPFSLPSLPATRLPPNQTITLSHLEKLLRQSSNSIHREYLYRTLFTLDASSLPRIFGQVGLDSSFLTAFLEALLSIPERETKWVEQSIALLDGLRRCGRFGIAVVFIPAEKWKTVFEEVERYGDVEQMERLVTVKRFWSV
jgi:hypothetical protein